MLRLSVPVGTTALTCESSQYIPDADGFIEVHVPSHVVELVRHGCLIPDVIDPSIPLDPKISAALRTADENAHLRAQLDDLRAQMAMMAVPALPDTRKDVAGPGEVYSDMLIWLKDNGVAVAGSPKKEEVAAMVASRLAELNA